MLRTPPSRVYFFLYDFFQTSILKAALMEAFHPDDGHMVSQWR